MSESFSKKFADVKEQLAAINGKLDAFIGKVEVMKEAGEMEREHIWNAIDRLENRSSQ